MGLYVEVQCDARKQGHRLVGPNRSLVARCWSDCGDSAQGVNVVDAKREARRQGWKLGRGNSAICPGCR